MQTTITFNVCPEGFATFTVTLIDLNNNIAIYTPSMLQAYGLPWNYTITSTFGPQITSVSYSRNCIFLR